MEFLDELRAAYDRIVEGPLKYQELRSGIRRALLRRFPYAAYFAVEGKSLSCWPWSMQAEIQRSGSDAEASFARRLLAGVSRQGVDLFTMAVREEFK